MHLCMNVRVLLNSEKTENSKDVRLILYPVHIYKDFILNLCCARNLCDKNMKNNSQFALLIYL